MRKKIALLLVLTMIVSLIPSMNVFGRTRLEVPDEEIIELPANIITKLRIDLGTLNERAQINSEWGWDNQFDGNRRAYGYPLTIKVDDDAQFGGDLSLGDDILGDFLLHEDTEPLTSDEDDVINSILFANIKSGLWNENGPAFVAAYDEDSNEGDYDEDINDGSTAMSVNSDPYYVDAAGKLQEGSAPAVRAASAATTTVGGLQPSEGGHLESGGTVETAVSTGWWANLTTGTATGGRFIPASKFDSSVPGATLRPASTNPEVAVIPSRGATETDAQYTARLETAGITVDAEDAPFTWEDFALFFDNVNPIVDRAPELYTISWIPVELNNDNNELTILIQVFDANGELVMIPDVDDNNIFVEIALPIFLDSGSWDSNLYLLDETDSRAELYKTALVGGTDPWVEVETGEIASFASTGFIDTVEIQETINGFLNSGSADAGARFEGQIGLQLRLTSDYAFLMENSRQRLTFSDTQDTYHDEDDEDSADAYRVLGEWGKDSRYDDIEYRFDYEIGTRRIGNQIDDENGSHEYDLMLVFPSDDAFDDDLQARYDVDVLDRADVLEIHNLMVAFDERQQYNTEIGLEYQLVVRDDPDADWYDADEEFTYLDGDHDDWEDASGNVVTRGEDVPTLSIIDERGLEGVEATTVPTLVTGLRGEETAIFRISEKTTGSWDTSPMTISVPAGIEITGAHVGIYEYPFSAYSADARADEGSRVAGTVKDNLGASGNEDDWTDDGDSSEYRTIQYHQEYFNNDGIRVNNNSIVIDPLQTYLTTDGARREIEVQLEVSIEPGYVARNKEAGITSLNVNFSGSFTHDSFKIADLRDPIEVSELTVNPATVDWNMNVYNHEVGDITITETLAGTLNQNDEIWLYVVGAGQLDLNLSANQNPVVNTAESGLEMYSGVQLRHSFGSFMLNGLRYNVRRASGLGQFNTTAVPGSITFQDVTISGTLAKGAEYQIVISGNAIAENNYVVWSNDLENRLVNPEDDSYATVNNAQDQNGIFDVLPYTISAIGWEEDTYEEAPTTEAPATVNPDAPSTTAPIVVPVRIPREFNLYTFTTDESGQYNNYMIATPLVPVTNNGGFAAIAPAAFNSYIGTTTSFVDQIATITGEDANGNAVTIQFAPNSPNAVVNGTTVDIAQYGGDPNYPVGSIAPYFHTNNHFYLPVRFLCKAFGIDYAYNPATNGVTLY